jgi:phage terminase large subunit-like protein
VSKDLDKIMRMIPHYDPFVKVGDCYVDYDEAQRAIDFFHTHLRLIEGEMADLPFALQLWQQAILANLFGWKWGKDQTRQLLEEKKKRIDLLKPTLPEDVYTQIMWRISNKWDEIIERGLRRYNRSLIFVPRKNGKTPYCAGVINYVGFCDGEPGAQIYCAAAEKEQAGLVYRHASGMIAKNPELKKKSTPHRSFKSIEFYDGSTVFRALSADAETKHGQNAHLIVVDELHVQKNRELVDTLETSTASRLQPLIVYITTAGVLDKLSICWEKYDHAKKVCADPAFDPCFLPVLYEAEKDDDWRDEKTWYKANPNLGVSVSLKYLQDECRGAIESAAKENVFRRLHLNQWTEQDVRWINMDKWRQCVGDVKESELLGLQCFGALDLGATSDLTAMVLLFTDGGRWRMLPYFWVPEETVRRRSEKDRVPYDAWVKQGFIRTTPGNTTDYDFIRKDINELGDKFGIKKLAVDRLFQGAQLSTQLMGDGFEVITFNQSFMGFAAPCKAFEELVLSGELEHGDNPVLNWMAANVAVEMDANGNMKPSKRKSHEKIDGIVCSVMAVGLANAELETKSVYDQRGVLTI